MPPRDLLLWVRDLGLQYRSVRENLWTIDAELKNVDSLEFQRWGKKYARFTLAYRNYLRSIIEYGRCTISWYGLSVYRGSDHTIQTVMDLVGSPETTDEGISAQVAQFYKHGIITDFEKELSSVCDVLLPQHWQAVCRSFREVQMAEIDAAS